MNIKKRLTTKIETPTEASTGLSPPCVYAQTDEKGNANSIKRAITPCDIAFATSSPKVGIYSILDNLSLILL